MVYIQKVAKTKLLFIYLGKHCVFSLLVGGAASAQNRTVTGVVSATSGESVIGAGVLIDGTTKGVTTDIDGKYSIEVQGDATLVFSSIGYKTFFMKQFHYLTKD